MVQKAFIPLKPCRFHRRGGLKSLLLSTTLIRYKYHLYIINEIVNITGPLKDVVYTYEYMHGGLSCFLYFYCRGSSKIKHVSL